MSNAVLAFNEENAATYDARFARLAPIRDVLHLATRALLADLPPDAHILCVGVGTGAEVLALAEAFPGWRFTGVDPAGAMLAIFRRRAEEAGIAGRCTFHEGYLETLPPSRPFDAATAFLVSHFLVDPEARRAFFRQIAARLRPGSLLVSADLAAGASIETRERLMPVWFSAMRQGQITPEQLEGMRTAYARDVALLPVAEVEAIIASAGFEAPTQFLQALMIHGWFARLP